MSLVTEKVKTEIMRHYKAHVRLWLLRTGSIEEEQTPKQRIGNYCNCLPSYRSVK